MFPGVVCNIQRCGTPWHNMEALDSCKEMEKRRKKSTQHVVATAPSYVPQRFLVPALDCTCCLRLCRCVCVSHTIVASNVPFARAELRLPSSLDVFGAPSLYGTQQLRILEQAPVHFHASRAICAFSLPRSLPPGVSVCFPSPHFLCSMCSFLERLSVLCLFANSVALTNLSLVSWCFPATTGCEKSCKSEADLQRREGGCKGNSEGCQGCGYHRGGHFANRCDYTRAGHVRGSRCA